jgi:hypothetical protein
VSSAPPQGPFSGTPARRGGIRPAQAVVLGLAIALLMGSVAWAVSSGGDKQSAARTEQKEVFTEPISTARNPFAPAVGTDAPRVPAVHPQGVSTQVGGQPGLYGGTMDRSSCDKQQLISYLQTNTAKADAWASTLGIQVSQISTYVNSLTPVLLRSDTRVTNHGYVDGRATSFQTVLQAGTAVLVDDKGEPVTKCYCGNPLTPPIAYPPVYYGPRWYGFNPQSLTVIVQNTTVVNIFTLVDASTGQTFTTPAGSNGTGTPAPSTGATPTPSGSTTSVATGDKPTLAKLERLAKECYPFPGIEKDVKEVRSTSPSSDPNTLVLRVEGTTASGATQIFSWQVDRQTLVFTPIDDLARRVTNDCPAFSTPG